jgi:hypothetical protein
MMGNASLVVPKYSKWGGSACPSPSKPLAQVSRTTFKVFLLRPWFIFSDKRADSKVRE